MATTGQLSLMVVDRATGKLCGAIGASELLTGRKRAAKRESERSTTFQLRTVPPLERSQT